MNWKQGLASLIAVHLNLLTYNLHAHPSRLELVNPEIEIHQQGRYLGRLRSDKLISFDLWLKFRNEEKLKQAVNAIYDPHSPQYQKYLSPEILERDYKPEPNIQKILVSYLKNQGMKATVSGHHLKVMSSVSAIEKTFQIHMNQYLFQNQSFYANDTLPSIDANLAEYISGITGLSNKPIFNPHLSIDKISAHASLTNELNFLWENFNPTATPSNTSLSGISGAQMQTAYAINAIPPILTHAINGNGQTLVIINSCPYITVQVSNKGKTTSQKIIIKPSDMLTELNIFNTKSKLSLMNNQNFTVLNSDLTPYVASSSCTTTNQSWSGAVALTIEAAHSLAPNANIVLVLSNNENALSTTLSNVISHLTNSKTKNSLGGFSNVFVISNGWGGIETNNNPLDTGLAAAAATGLSIYFSSGDAGDNIKASKLSSAAVNYPASSAYVTSVGGSSLFLDTAYNYSFETAWGSGVDLPYGGSSGGISRYYLAPTWQSSITPLTALGYSGTIGTHTQNGSTLRAVPDIAALGDGSTGFNFCYEYNSTTTCQFVRGAGTALSSTIIAASTLLINQARLLQGKTTPIGLLAPYLYNNYDNLLLEQAINVMAPPHQIISGATLVTEHPYSFQLNGYYFNWDSTLGGIETQFWSDATGAGTPNLPNFVPFMAVQ